MADKRDRSTNFTEEDKELLITTVSENFIHVIDNKRTDGTTIREKNEAWEQVAVIFNSTSSNQKRSGMQLKTAYNNIKRKLKKERADEKVEIYKTGGGPPCTSKMTDAKGRLLHLLQPQIEPLYNAFDSSARYFHGGGLRVHSQQMAPQSKNGTNL